MREIKYRVYLEEFNEMFYDVGILGGELYVKIDGHGYDNLGDYKDFKIMQYTGLTDKSGREIYEGDVLRRTAHWDFYVGFEDGNYIAIPTNVVQRVNKMTWILTPAGVSEREIIGNVYENLELLEGEE